MDQNEMEEEEKATAFEILKMLEEKIRKFKLGGVEGISKILHS